MSCHGRSEVINLSHYENDLYYNDEARKIPSCKINLKVIVHVIKTSLRELGLETHIITFVLGKIEIKDIRIRWIDLDEFGDEIHNS